jgi:hypothetical protein
LEGYDVLRLDYASPRATARRRGMSWWPPAVLLVVLVALAGLLLAMVSGIGFGRLPMD